MFYQRVIPVLLLDKKYLYKTRQFKDPVYLGDPINTIKIFNNKEVDELILLDIGATRDGTEPNYKYLEGLATEAFMPMAYGGGIKNLEQIRNIFSIGYEKIVLNTQLLEEPEFCRSAVEKFGAQSIVASIDVKLGFNGRYKVVTRCGTVSHDLSPVDFAVELEKCGVGEVMINSVDRDGCMQGYDLPLIKAVASAVQVPVIACGGAGQLLDFKDAVDMGASAVAAGSYFVFYGKHKAVLITYPKYRELEKLLEQSNQPQS